MSRVAESGASESEDGGAYGGVGNDLDAEDFCEAWAAVWAKGAKDEIFAFLIEYEDSRYHGFRGRSISVVWLCRLE
jgi:hypothetical protein